ncbi:hypothetical protein BDZ91DRAFT_799603 [Kalaharituber pfeilii]|nr:hypothetical protein BDZ91DRAFT_799603 [Kalaharituber pfeilii]
MLTSLGAPPVYIAPRSLPTHVFTCNTPPCTDKEFVGLSKFAFHEKYFHKLPLEKRDSRFWLHPCPWPQCKVEYVEEQALETHLNDVHRGDRPSEPEIAGDRGGGERGVGKKDGDEDGEGERGYEKEDAKYSVWKVRKEAKETNGGAWKLKGKDGITAATWMQRRMEEYEERRAQAAVAASRAHAAEEEVAYEGSANGGDRDSLRSGARNSPPARPATANSAASGAKASSSATASLGSSPKQPQNAYIPPTRQRAVTYASVAGPPAVTSTPILPISPAIPSGPAALTGNATGGSPSTSLYPCYILGCSHVSVTVLEFYKHERKFHQIKDKECRFRQFMLKCPYAGCRIRSMTQLALEKHVKLEHGGMPAEEMRHVQQAQPAPISTFTGAGGGGYHCYMPGCMHICATLLEFARHEKIFHRIPKLDCKYRDLMVKCPYLSQGCEAKGMTQEEIDKHVRAIHELRVPAVETTHHEEEQQLASASQSTGITGPPYACYFHRCPESFATLLEFCRHERKVHGIPRDECRYRELLLRCPYGASGCNMKFMDEETLAKHLEVGHPMVEDSQQQDKEEEEEEKEEEEEEEEEERERKHRKWEEIEREESRRQARWLSRRLFEHRLVQGPARFAEGEAPQGAGNEVLADGIRNLLGISAPLPSASMSRSRSVSASIASGAVNLQAATFTSSGTTEAATDESGSHPPEDASTILKFTCEFPGCGRDFTDLGRYALHEKVHPEWGHGRAQTFMHKCTFKECKHLFTSVELLQKHLARRHGQDGGGGDTSTVEPAVPRKQSLTPHSILSSPSNRHLKLQPSARAVGTIATFSASGSGSSGPAEYRCAVADCSAHNDPFEQLGDLIWHERRVHKSLHAKWRMVDGVLVLLCPLPECEQGFTTQQALEEHILGMHTSAGVRSRWGGKDLWGDGSAWGGRATWGESKQEAGENGGNDWGAGGGGSEHERGNWEEENERTKAEGRVFDYPEACETMY